MLMAGDTRADHAAAEVLPVIAGKVQYGLMLVIAEDIPKVDARHWAKPGAVEVRGIRVVGAIERLRSPIVALLADRLRKLDDAIPIPL